MFNPSAIQTALSEVVGFDPVVFPNVSNSLKTSLSGQFINQSAHPLLTLDNIKSVAPGQEDSEVMDAYLTRVRSNAAINLFNAVFQEKKLYETAKTILSDTSLYDGPGNLKTKIVKLGRFVGYEIKPRQKDTVVTISQVGLQFDTLNPEFKLYIYHSGSSEPIHEIEIGHSKAITFDWKEITPVKLPFNSNSLSDNGTYYIGYYENDLLGQAVWKDQSFSGTGCASCNKLNDYLYNQWGTYLSVQPMYIESAYLEDDKTFFDAEKNIQLNNQNWGLNFKISVQCDVTDLIVRNKLAFANALKVQIAHDLLNDMAYSTRDNGLKEKTKQLAMYALDNRENGQKGMIKELEQAVQSVGLDMSGLSPVCLPCNKSGMRIKSVF